MPPSSAPTPRGLSLPDLVGTLGGGLLTLGVTAPGPDVDDITLAEPAAGIFGQAGDLLLGVGVESGADAVGLLTAAATAGSGGVVLRRAVARRREVRAAARKVGMPLVELTDHASWAHVVWLLRGLLDRAASGSVVRPDGPVHDELFALADACAALVGAPVTIEDTQSRVLAYSSSQDVVDPVRVSTIVGRKVPDAILTSLRGRGVFRRLATSDEPFYVPADGTLRPRLVVPVRAGREWLGSIWAVVDSPPQADVVRSLAQTASVVALHLLRLRSQADLDRRVSADRLRMLVGGDARDAGAWLPPGPWRVVVLGGGPGVDVQALADLWESVSRRHRWRQPLLTILDERVVALTREVPAPATEPTRAPLSSGDPATAPGTWGWLRAVVLDVAATLPGATASAGRPVADSSLLAASRQEALEVDRLRAPTAPLPSGYPNTPRSPVTDPATTIEQVWAAVTVERAVGGIRRPDLLGPVPALAAHDEAHGTDYAATLAAWLDHPGNPRRAAQQLHVHPNTLRYRLQRLPGVTDDELADPRARLAMRLQLWALGH